MDKTMIPIGEMDSLPPLEDADLRARAIGLVRAMSSGAWTNAEDADLSVATLEQLCQTLTEASDQARRPVADLLGTPKSAPVELRRHGLAPAWSILPCNPVTTNDLRRLVIDRVPDLANAWFEPAEAQAATGVRGLYDVYILPADHEGRTEDPDTKLDSDAPGDQDAGLTQRVLRCYRRHRSLCEDVDQVRILRRAPVEVRAELQIEDAADPSETMAQLLFALSLLFAPEPSRRSLAQQLATDGAVASALQGPIMLRGFIAPDQLRPRPRSLSVDRIEALMSQIAGVLSVDSLSVSLVGEAAAPPGGTIAVPADGVLWLRPTDSAGVFPIRMRRDRQDRPPQAARVRRRLEALWTEHRRTYPLRAEIERRWATPTASGRDRVVAADRVAFKSPAGRPHDDAAPFDQLLAEHFSQIARLPQLFSVRAQDAASAASPPLLGAPLDVGLARLTAEADAVDPRREKMLDLLLSLYGQAGDASQDRAQAMVAKTERLRRIAGASRDRGRGTDYDRRRSRRSASGVERISCLQLGMPDPAAEERPATTAGQSDAVRRGRQLHIVEWILLRAALTTPSDVPDDATPYSFRITAVLDEAGSEEAAAWRREAQAVLRANTPAHVALDCLFVAPDAMERFEQVYDVWTLALRHDDEAGRAYAGRQLIAFLNDPTAPPAPTPQIAPATQPPTPEEPTADGAIAEAPAEAEPVAEAKQPMDAELSPAPSPTPSPKRGWGWRLPWLHRKRPRRAPVMNLTLASADAAPTLPGRSGVAAVESVGVDAGVVMTASAAKAFAENEFTFVVRHLASGRLAAPEAAGSNLTADEAAEILGAGLALMAVQPAPPPPWKPSAALGYSQGWDAVLSARAAGLPSGVSVWLDLTGHAADVSPESLSTYGAAWFGAVSQAGYTPGLCVGRGCGLSAQQLLATPFRYFWACGGGAPELGGRGYCMTQTVSGSYLLDGVGFNLDVVHADRDGNTPVWLAPVRA